jgi:hypothetical protein
MLDPDGRRHDDLREEEMACDVWAREFMTVKLAAYAQDHAHRYREVLRKRLMGFALAALKRAALISNQHRAPRQNRAQREDALAGRGGGERIVTADNQCTFAARVTASREAD